MHNTQELRARTQHILDRDTRFGQEFETVLAGNARAYQWPRYPVCFGICATFQGVDYWTADHIAARHGPTHKGVGVPNRRQN